MVFIDKLKELKILVVGDIMLDTYIVGDVTRISPEAPVPIVVPRRKNYQLGGAGNVVANLRSIGIYTTFFGMRGRDRAGKIVEDNLIAIGADLTGIIISDKINTTEKVRIISSHRSTQMLRLDYDMAFKTPSSINTDFEDILRAYVNNFDAAIVSDYNKGTITPAVMEILTSSNLKYIIVDPKPEHSRYYDGVFAIVPNHEELNAILRNGGSLPDVNYILETRGKNGMALHNTKDKNAPETTIIPSINVEVCDVTGAGDSVVAILTACLCLGLNIFAAAQIANECAHYAVSTFGTSVVPKEIFQQSFNKCFIIMSKENGT